MGKIVISENTSLDGVIEGPTAQEDFGFAGWFDRTVGGDREAWAKVEFEEALAAEAMLMGRRTYEWFAARGWPSRGGDWPDRLRGLPKYVVSSTPVDLVWANSTVLTGDVVTAVSTLKREVAGDIVVNGSGRLVHALIEHDLVDELRLMVFACVVGQGRRLFDGVSAQRAMRLVDTRTVGDGIVRLTYRRPAVRLAPAG